MDKPDYSLVRAIRSVTAVGAMMAGVMAISMPAQADEANPLLAGSSGVKTMSAQAMDDVQGTGAVSDYYGERGLQYLNYSYYYGAYARYQTAPTGGAPPSQSDQPYTPQQGTPQQGTAPQQGTPQGQTYTYGSTAYSGIPENTYSTYYDRAADYARYASKYFDYASAYQRANQ